MMKLKQDATSSIIGIIYQFYKTLEYCFLLREGEKIIIEKYGDISILDNLQMEVKHYKDSLTDTHHNLWKTLSNWLDDDFEENHYKVLVLMTTQKYANTTTLKEWNDKTKENKLEILKAIKKVNDQRGKSSDKTKELLEKVLDRNKEDKLLKILDKFEIITNATGYNELPNKIKDQYAKGIMRSKQDEFINSLLGYVIPTNDKSSSWEISFEDFSRQVETISSRFSSTTKIFPKINSRANDQEVNSYTSDKHLFIKKIEDINYDEVRNEAITHYIETNSLISREFSSYSISKNDLEHYENELLSMCKTKHRKASRNSSISNIINDSQDFYDDIIGSEAKPFLDYNDTGTTFRNGLLHNMADSEEKGLVWKLTPKN